MQQADDIHPLKRILRRALAPFASVAAFLEKRESVEYTDMLSDSIQRIT